MKSSRVRIQDHQRGGKVVFSITAAQLEQLRRPDVILARYRNARRDPRDALVQKGLLMSEIAAGTPMYSLTRHGRAVLAALEHLTDHGH